MTFEPEKVPAFLALFEQAKPKISRFEGCHHLALWQDAQAPNVYCTYSHWQNLAALENYRHSPLFKEVWAQTKALFAAKPQAFSVYQQWQSGPVPGPEAP